MSLEVAAGSFVVLLGPSGCGKTTLLKLANRLHDPTSGRVLVDGRPAADQPAAELRRGIGYVIQQSGLFPHFRVGDNVATVPRLLGWDKARVAARVDDLLNLVGLPPAEYRHRWPAQLSGGEQQRVGLARALAADPRIVLMDEPFGALDAITRGRLQDEVRRIHARLGQTVLFVTHDIEEAVRLADRIVVMRDGRVVQHGTPLAIVTEPADAFVADLVGAHDVLRRLSLLTVGAAMRPLAGGAPDAPAVSQRNDLRHALGLLLQDGTSSLVVVDDDGNPVGQLDLPAIQGVCTPVAEPAGTPA